LEARVGIEPTHKGFADLSLTTWVPRLTQSTSAPDGSPTAEHEQTGKNLERETGFEPATSTLARSHSTTELLPLDVKIIPHPTGNRGFLPREQHYRGLEALGQFELYLFCGPIQFRNSEAAHLSGACRFGFHRCTYARFPARLQH
jgi:hypothetical protein